MGVSDQEAKDAARLIAKGDKTLEEYTVELQQKAAIEYPQLADRFKLNPKLTTYEIASPVIKMLAKTWKLTKELSAWITHLLCPTYDQVEQMARV
jgi:hypothetical protein